MQIMTCVGNMGGYEYRITRPGNSDIRGESIDRSFGRMNDRHMDIHDQYYSFVNPVQTLYLSWTLES